MSVCFLQTTLFQAKSLGLRWSQLLLQVTVRELLAQVRQDFSPSGNFFGGESANLTLTLLYDTLDDLEKHGKVVYHAHSANPVIANRAAFCKCGAAGGRGGFGSAPRIVCHKTTTTNRDGGEFIGRQSLPGSAAILWLE